MRPLLVSLAVLLLAACGGGGGSSPSSPVTSPLQFPNHPNSHYWAEGLPSVTAAEAQRLPVYSNGSELIVGVDQRNFDLGNLPEVGKRGGFSMRQGQVDDGAGTQALRRYLSATVDDPALRWKATPIVRFGGDGDRHDFQRVIRTVQLVNAALPDGSKMRIASASASANPGAGIYIDFQEDYGHADWGSILNAD